MVTGRLGAERGGPSVDDAKPRRTIYTKQYRNKRDALLGVFDAPDGIAPTGQRIIFHCVRVTASMLLRLRQLAIESLGALNPLGVRVNPGG